MYRITRILNRSTSQLFPLLLPASSRPFQLNLFSNKYSQNLPSNNETSSELVPITFSSLIKSKLPASRLARFQKIWGKAGHSFLCELAEAKDVLEILELTERNAESLETVDVAAASEVLFALLKDERSASRRKELWNSVGMQKYCKVLRRKSKSMSVGDLIGALKLLNILDVPANDTNMEIILKILTKHINQMECTDIVYLHFLLKKFPSEPISPIISALDVALPVVFESQILHQSQSGELDHENAQSLCDLLHYAARHNKSDKTISSIIAVLDKKLGEITPRQAMSILWSLGDARHNEANQEMVVRKCFGLLAENLDTFEMEIVSTTVGKASKKYLKKVNFFYNEDFVQAYCNRLMIRKCAKEHTLFGFKYISMFRHIHVEFMDRVGELIAENPADLINNDFLFVQIVRAFSGCNYKPENWPKFEAILLNHPAITKDLGLQEVHLAIDFLALAAYPDALVQKIFSPENIPRLEVFLNKSPINSSHAFILLLNAVKLLVPEYGGSFPPLSLIEKAKQLVKEDNRAKKLYPLKGPLQSGFGGENYVIHGVYHNGIHIDHAILMRKGGYPVAINNASEIMELSDIQKPSDSEIVLVKVFWSEAYANNTPRLRGVMQLEQQVLEKLGHPLIVIDGKRWTESPEHEKIPYLMIKIREKMEKLQWNQSGSDVIPR